MTTPEWIRPNSLRFGEQVRKRRISLGLTQRDLGQRINCSIVTIRKIESGERRPSDQLAMLMAKHLELATETWQAFVEQARGPAATAVDASADGLIGREADIARVITALESARLVVIIGPGGVGKTTLADEVLRRTHVMRIGSAHWISLAALTDPALLPSALCIALDVKPAIQAALESRLKLQQTLLVLDNFEQISAGAPVLAALLKACPLLTMLVTSRHVLGLKGEHVLDLQPLQESDAVSLFVRRATQAQRSDDARHALLSEAQQRACLRICEWVDGLPLAIELVAARTVLMSPQLLLARLEQTEMAPVPRHRMRLDLVADGISNLPERHRSLSATIRWSYALLSPVEQRALRVLAIFEDGWTLQAAEVLLMPAGSTSPSDAETIDVWNVLTVLMDRSFVRKHVQDGQTRFSLLETIRAFALDQQRATNEAGELAIVHARYFLAVATAINPELSIERDSVEAARALEEAANFRAALATANRLKHAGLALQLCRALTWFWQFTGVAQEGLSWVRSILVWATDAAPDAALLRMVRGDQARLNWASNQIGQAAALARALLVDAQQHHDQPASINALSTLGNCAGDIEAFGEARAHYAQALALCRQQGDFFMRGRLHLNIGMFATHEADLKTAYAAFVDSQALAQACADPSLVALSELGLGMVAVRRKNSMLAAVHLARAISAIGRHGFMGYLPETLSEIASLLLLAGHDADAARLLGSVRRVLADQHTAMNPMDRRVFESNLQLARRGLDGAVFEAELAVGVSHTGSQAIADAADLLARIQNTRLMT